MLLEVLHETRYDYAPAVRTAQHLAHLKPAHDARQQLVSHELAITPEPVQRSEAVDVWGNARTFFSLDALHLRKGVCQDFAHVMLACLRSLGLAARYVSGYLLTQPPPGQTKLVGSDASHAWVSVYVPGDGTRGEWLDLDPTNRRVPGE